MNINAKQLQGIDVHKMDITTALGFFRQVKNQVSANMTLMATLGSV